MSTKEEILESLEFYKRNVLMVLGDKDSTTRAIEQCIRLTKEVEDKQGYWQDISIVDNDLTRIDVWHSYKCSECGLYVTIPYMYSLNLYNFCPHCGADMQSKR